MKALKIPNDIVIIQVTDSRWRIARVIRHGFQYSNPNNADIGITNIRSAFLISGPLSQSEVDSELRKYCTEIVEFEETPVPVGSPKT